jgi:methionine--tRNA ligase beta chain
MATINDFAALDLRIGEIIEVSDIEGARKPLYALRVDLGELGIRNIAAGIKSQYAPEELLGKRVVVVANLEPKSIAGFVSEGMVLAAESGDKIVLLSPDSEMAPGSKVH